MKNHINDLYINNLLDIVVNEWEVDNRAKWKDGSQVKTKRELQVVNKWDLNDGFPITTLRPINWKASIDEIIWIYVKKSNDIKDLNSSIWKAWADENGIVQKAYGHQVAKPTMGFNSQIEYVIEEIKRNPTSRRIQLNMFNAEEQLEKATKSLIECAYALHFSVKNGQLHMTLIQRSGDFLTAAGFGSWNTVGYAFLQHAIAKECGLGVGIFTHFVQDLHLYNKHESHIMEILERDEHREASTEKVTIEIADKPFFELTSDDVQLHNYNPLPSIGKLDVAI